MGFSDFNLRSCCRWFAFVSMLSACVAQPGPDWNGAKRTEITKNGVGYVVLQKDDVVEVRRRIKADTITFNSERLEMIELIDEVSGCNLREPTLVEGLTWFRGRVICD